MTVPMKPIVIAAFCALLAAPVLASEPPTSAQPATEQAQRFLEQALPGSAYDSPFLQHLMEKVYSQDANGRVNEKAKVRSAKLVSPCVSMFRYAYSKDAVLEYRSGGELRHRLVRTISPDFVTGRGQQGNVNFKELASVEQLGSQVVLRFDEAVRDIFLELKDEPTAEKVKASLQLLQTSCNQFAPG